MQEIAPKKSKLTLYIGIALVLGIITGFFLNSKYVGEENLKLANAEVQQKALNGQIKTFEKGTDTTLLKNLIEQKVKIEGLKKTTEKSLLTSEEGTSTFKNVNIFADSIKSIDKNIALLLDTTNANYKSFTKQMSLVSAQKTEVTKARDKKLEWFTLLADIFLRLIKMIVAPLVFTTLVVGVAKLGDISAVGRIGGKTLLWFLSASLMSLLLGLVLVNFFKPGIAMHLPLPDAGTSSGIDKAALTVKDFFYHVFPTSFIDAMAKNEILQIVVFSLFFGVACAALGDVAMPIVKALDAASHIILKITGYVMKFAPVAVFGAMAAIIAKQGLGHIPYLLGSFILGLVYFGYS